MRGRPLRSRGRPLKRVPSRADAFGMEVIVWLTVGALTGAVAALAFPAGGPIGTLRSMAVGCVAALAGALAMDTVVGAIARVRVSIVSGQAYATVWFSLAPAIAAAIAAIAVLVLLARVKRDPAR
jgi:uncharacterized membrane protein YeaQ/YmgE (transglycosylase-associated protein family)